MNRHGYCNKFGRIVFHRLSFRLELRTACDVNREPFIIYSRSSIVALIDIKMAGKRPMPLPAKSNMSV